MKEKSWYTSSAMPSKFGIILSRGVGRQETNTDRVGGVFWGAGEGLGSQTHFMGKWDYGYTMQVKCISNIHTHTLTLQVLELKKSFSFSSPPKTSTVLKKLDLFSITPEGIWNRTLTKVGRDEQSYAMLLDDDDVDVGDVLQTSTYTEG